jgi:hypothetical protein
MSDSKNSNDQPKTDSQPAEKKEWHTPALTCLNVGGTQGMGTPGAPEGVTYYS